MAAIWLWAARYRRFPGNGCCRTVARMTASRSGPSGSRWTANRGPWRPGGSTSTQPEASTLRRREPPGPEAPGRDAAELEPPRPACPRIDGASVEQADQLLGRLDGCNPPRLADHGELSEHVGTGRARADGTHRCIREPDPGEATSIRRCRVVGRPHEKLAGFIGSGLEIERPDDDPPVGRRLDDE